MTIFGDPDARTLQQLQTCYDALQEPDARSTLCADAHVGYSMPIGGVLASKRWVAPAGVGFDIACGNCAVRTNLLAKDCLLYTSDAADE